MGCTEEECGVYDKTIPGCWQGLEPDQCGGPLIAETASVADVPCNVGLDTHFFMEKRLPHLLNIAEELLTWCIEEDKKGIYRDYIKKYRKEHEDIIEKGV